MKSQETLDEIPSKFQRSQNFLDLNSRVRTNSPSRMLALVSLHKIPFKLHRFESGPEHDHSKCKEFVEKQTGHVLRK